MVINFIITYAQLHKYHHQQHIIGCKPGIQEAESEESYEDHLQRPDGTEPEKWIKIQHRLQTIANSSDTIATTAYCMWQNHRHHHHHYCCNGSTGQNLVVDISINPYSI